MIPVISHEKDILLWFGIEHTQRNSHSAHDTYLYWIQNNGDWTLVAIETMSSEEHNEVIVKVTSCLTINKNIF